MLDDETKWIIGRTNYWLDNGARTHAEAQDMAQAEIGSLGYERWLFAQRVSALKYEVLAALGVGKLVDWIDRKLGGRGADVDGR